MTTETDLAGDDTSLPDIACAAAPRAALARCPAHCETPLLSLDGVARHRGWSTLLAKDERARMGLGSFKALGGAYAVFRIVEAYDRAAAACEAVSIGVGGAHSRRLTVICASAGNHGLSVAAGARVFGVACEVFLPETAPEPFAERLRARGATVRRAGAVYEDAMAAAVERALADGVTLVSDASWPGETAAPSMVMQGYAVLCEELREDFVASGRWPTHVAIQAGVGGLAAAMAAHIRRFWPTQPQILVVEPDRAPCLARSVDAGRALRVEGPVSIMGRLDCKSPSERAFQILRRSADRFLTISDQDAEAATALLAAHGVETTPSGAAGLAGLIAADLRPDAAPLIVITERALV